MEVQSPHPPPATLPLHLHKWHFILVLALFLIFLERLEQAVISKAFSTFEYQRVPSPGERPLDLSLGTTCQCLYPCAIAHSHAFPKDCWDEQRWPSRGIWRQFSTGVENTNFGTGDRLGKGIFHVHTKLHCSWECG